ncbi:MAG: 4Fe-4S binding protein [Prevotellaceae bacterium]|nr:4Fe-4S binding protein [Prevotellaceae bacterium]
MGKTIGAVKVDTERCKGCGLCVEACPTGSLALTSRAVNHKGYTYCQQTGDSCTGCAACAIVCPDACLAVYRATRAGSNPTSHE